MGHTKNLMQEAIACRKAGLSIFPVGENKAPVVEELIPYMENIALLDETEEWFYEKHDYMAMMGGAVSGHLEFVDCDPKKERPDTWKQYAELVNQEAPGLLDKLIIERTPNLKYKAKPHKPGYHLAYRCPDITIPGNTKLAQFVTDNEGKPKVETSIETRGERGYCVVAPSPGYELLQGSYENVPVITKEERDILIKCSRALNEYVEPQQMVTSPKSNPTTTSELRPGDDFNNRTDMGALIEKSGWQHVKSNGKYPRYRRPGKEGRGYSASLMDNKILYVFSSNAFPFEAGRGYDAFAFYTTVEHEGDFSAAAKALAQEGYGSQKVTSIKDHPEFAPTSGFLVGTDELEDSFVKVRDWLYREHLPKGAPIMFAAREGDGKTSNLIQICKETLEANPDGIILWVATEGKTADTADKIQQLRPGDRFKIIRKPPRTKSKWDKGEFSFNFLKTYDLKVLENAIIEAHKLGYKVLAVIIDSIRGMTPYGDSESEIKNAMYGVNAICEKYEASAIYIDHHNKQISIKNLLDRVSGSTAKTSAVALVYAILPTGSYVRKIVCAKSNILHHTPYELHSALGTDGIVISEMKRSAYTLKAQAQKWLIDIFRNQITYESNFIKEEGQKKRLPG